MSIRTLLRNWRAVLTLDGRRQIAQRTLANAVQTDHARLLTLSVRAGADVNAPLAHGIAALQLATQRGNAATVAALLRHGAVPDTNGGPHGFTPLLMAVQNNRPDIAVQLLAAGAQVDRAGAKGLFPLMLAAMYDHVEMAEILLQHHANPALTDPGAGTALHAAVHNSNVPMAALLLSYGANPNAPAANGVTPRHLAEEQRREEILALMRD